MSKKIIFSSGGTGGHMFPTIGVMQHFLKKNYEAILVTDNRGIFYLKNSSNIKYYIINTDSPTNKKYFDKFLSYTKIILSIFKSLFILIREKPNLVFGLGGYVSFPILIAAKILNIPLAIYENNMVLGRTNNYLLPISKKLLLASDKILNIPPKYKNKVKKVGHIIREDFLNHDLNRKKSEDNKFSLLILGGSQGAKIFGIVVPKVIKKIHDLGYNIMIYHQCIKGQKTELENFYKNNNINSKVFEFSNNILEFILKSDLVISRCGASTTAELAFTNTPFVAIPYPHAVDNHQYLNAKYYADKGLCWIIEQHNFSNENLFNLIIEIFKDKKKLQLKKENMQKDDFKLTSHNIEAEIKDLI